MHIYNDRKEIGMMTPFKLKEENHWFCFLDGVNFFNDKGNLGMESVYRSWINYYEHPGMATIETPWLIINFMADFPFIFFEKPVNMYLENQ